MNELYQTSHAPDDTRPQPINRFVLLGASNLTMSLRLVIQLLQYRLGRPSEVLVAAGHGRSYGSSSQVLIRELPAITASGLWSQLSTSKSLPTYALVTDIGNDVPYGYTPEQILTWVCWCVERLQKQKAELVMTNLPLASIESLSEQRYRIIRAIFFPFCRLSRYEIIRRIRVVHRGLLDMAARKHFQLCELESSWFGFDPIHVQFCKRKALYQHILKQFSVSAAEEESVGGKMPFLTWERRPQFAYKKLLGRTCLHQQPSGRLTDNSMVFMY